MLQYLIDLEDWLVCLGMCMLSSANICCCLNVNHFYSENEVVHCPLGAAKVVLQPPDVIRVALQGTIGDREVGVPHCLLLVNHLVQVSDRRSKSVSVKKINLMKRRRKGTAVFVQLLIFCSYFCLVFFLSISSSSYSKLCCCFEYLPIELELLLYTLSTFEQTSLVSVLFS